MSNPRIIPAVLTACLATAACTTAHLAVPTPLRDDRMEVSRSGGFFHQSKMAFGPYQVSGIDRSWTSTSSWSISGSGETKSKQRYQFQFLGGAGMPDDVRCSTHFGQDSVDLGVVTLEEKNLGLGCAFRSADGRPTGQLALHAVDEQTHSGWVQAEGMTLEVTSTRHLENAAWDTYQVAGYELRLQGQIVGMVQVFNGGAVWIDGQAPEQIRRAAAIAAASLLLFEDISEG
jgi:hypothetical protein